MTIRRIGAGFGAVAAAAVLSGVLLPSVASAQSDVRLIRPNVLIMLDTSGSMEWRNGVINDQCFGGDGGSCNRCVIAGGGEVAQCSPLCPADQQKNRWITALEVLTGDILNYSCRELPRNNATTYAYDYNYPIPYHEPLSGGLSLSSAGAQQAANGLLDTYIERLRFGFMSFDNDYCDGLTADYGQFSYGPNKLYRARGCADAPVSLNVGGRRTSTDLAMDPVPGGLISVGPPNADIAEMAQINARIQATITGYTTGAGVPVPGMRPFGGTPIAAMLEDANYYWTTSADVRQPNGGLGGDPYFACRPRYNLLITDGKPNMDFGVSDPGGPTCDDTNGYCPYQRPTLTAMQMAASGGSAPNVKTWVVAFNAMDPATITTLNGIATAGAGRLLTASDANSLRAALDTAFSTFAQGTTTRTSPAFGNSSASSGVSASYQFNTSFAIAAGAPWEGILERRRSVCEGAPPAPVDKAFDPAVDDFGVLLRLSERTAGGRGWGQRKLWSYVPAGASVTTLRGSLSSASTGVFQTNLDSSVPNTLVGAATTTLRDAAFAWLRGDPGTVRANKPLGDIYHSNPLIVGAPTVSLPDQSYAAFRSLPLAATGSRLNPVTVGTRETMLYVGSNDGVLHGFNADTGEEVWGFVPPILLPTMASRVPATRLFGVDGTTVSRDVVFERTIGTPTVAADWRSVVVVGLRDGGGAFVALDVTDPYRPRFLWQFTDSDLRAAYGTPMVTTIRTTWPTGALTERAVALLPGGNAPASIACSATANPRPASTRSSVRFTGADGRPRVSTRCWDGTFGEWVYVVDLKTGQLIRKMGTGAGGLSSTGTPIIGSFAGYLAGDGSVTSRAYIGDADGGLWRLDLSQPSPANWSFDLMYDLFWDAAYNQGQPIVSPPILTVDRNNDLLIGIGSGDPDLLEGFDLNRVAMIRESDPAPDNPVNPVDVGAHWILRQNADETKGLLPGERLTGPMSLFNGVLYFGTFVPANSTDACQLGFSRLWALDQTQIDMGAPAGPTALPMGRLDVDGDPSTTMDIVRVTRDLGGNGTLDDDVNSVLFGVGIVRRPACPNVQSAADPFFGGTRQYVAGMEGGDYRLVIQTGRGGGMGMVGGQRTNVVSRRLAPPQMELRMDSWATVFE
ncbi:MAG: PilC/PilY family type IV pilus protein [Polyangiales bacterium]